MSADKDFDRWSTLLGQPVRIKYPVGTPKAREDCQPFTFTLKTMEAPPEGAEFVGDGGRYTFTDENGEPRYGYRDVPNVKGQEKFMESLTKLRAKEAREATKRAKAAAKLAKVAA